MHSLEEMCVAGCTTRRGVRYWEEQELLGTVARSEGNTRRYTAKQMDLARIIAAAQFGGWAIGEIRQMIEEWGEEVHIAILTRLDDQIRAAVRLIEQLPRPVTVQEFDL